MRWLEGRWRGGAEASAAREKFAEQAITTAQPAWAFRIRSLEGRGNSSMGVALVFVLVAVGSVLFHVFSPWWWTPIASNWGSIDDTIIITFWITGIAFTGVVVFLSYCVFRFRHRKDARAEYEPENKKLEGWLTIGTALGVAAMLAPGLYVWHQFISVPKDATDVEVIGRQWQWSYRLPGKDGKLGSPTSRT